MPWILLANAAAASAAMIAAQPAQSEVPPAQAAPAEITLTDIIALETERYRRLTVPVTIRGQGPFRFMINTGAQATVVSNTLADQLELFDRETATLIAMASERQVETTQIDNIGLGSRKFDVSTAAIVEAGNLAGADGILGLDSLQSQRVLFDFENNNVAVADAQELGGDRGFDIVVRARQRLGQLIVQNAQIDGVDVAVIIDTGAQGSFGNLALQRRLRRGRDAADATMTDVNGVEVTGNSKRARSLEMGRANISNIIVTFADSPIFATLDLDDRPAMVLGMSELRLFKRVAIDFRSRRILFDMPDNVQISDRGLFLQ